MFKRVIQQKSSGSGEASSPKSVNSLKPTHVDLRLTVHHGIPASASVLAYEPGQRLLAIASRDGRIKIFGREGVEVLFKSPANAPCKYLEFVNNEGRLIHVTTRNEIEVWDLSTKELVSSKTWEADITAFAVIQATAFMYVGDETGQVSVLHFNNEDRCFVEMQYTVPAHLTLSGLIDTDDSSAPSVVSILPQPDAVHSRVVIVYGNGVIVLWGLHEAQVLAIRGGTEDQQRKLSGGKSSGSDEEEKEPCCACWACPSGTLLACGYTDGDIWLWNIPVNPKGKAEKPDVSSSPVLKIILSSEEFRMPVVVMRWSTSVKSDKGPSGYLYVFGGQEMGMAEVVTVLPVTDPACQMQLPLRGPFADVIILPSGPSIGNGAMLVLSSPGSLDVYEEANIYDSIKAEKPPAQPVPFQLPLTFSTVTCARLLAIPDQSIVASIILKIPRLLKGNVPPAFPSGMRWPVSGGNFSSTTVDRRSPPCLYITGHENGLINVWDASTPCLYFLASVNNRELVGSELASTCAIDFCPTVGLLAAGDEAGLVFVYTMQGESGEGTCHFISKNEPSTKREIEYSAGFQCFAILNLHTAPIRSLTIRTDCRCIAIGDDNGLVTLFDIEACVVRFHGKCGSPSGIVSSCFISLLARDPKSFKQDTIVLVLLKDACIAAIDGSSGKTIGSGRPNNPSVAISLHVLDPSGSSVKSVSRAPSRKASKRSVVMAVIETDSSGSHIEPAEGNEEIEEDVKQDDDWTGSDNLVLLCSEDSLRVYSISSVLQGMRTTIRKERLEKPCCAASVFDSGIHGSGLLLLYDTGDIEIRSLPALEVIKLTSLSESLRWEFGSSPSFFRTFAVASNGRVTAVDADQEVLFMSVVADENDMRLPGSYPLLYDKDVATATEAAIKASVQAAKKKQSQIQDLFGGVMKELKHSLGNAVGGERTALELPKLFSKQVSPVASHGTSIVKRLKAAASSESSSNERHSDRNAEQHTERQTDSPDKETELDIDDIDLGDDDLKSPSPSPSEGSVKKGGVMRKLRSSFNKGKKKASIKGDEDEERNMLFEGGSTETKQSSKTPTMRTAEEIKAAYGHKRSAEASSAAAHTRDRLMERQERLQNINRRTEEMQDSAENFASMAEELAKKMESRKWWEI
ncbi:uncharacterized protein LOC9636559 isoform X2 [Selaginella moellendorffii]|uniref:uncharacterized protein LOC9636559 isoform X2 n=1 Tax=Selaginella moellendorffii TaxID=88036 RepID=UPI000D1C619F|nr:uncharacterized protein LOC9636559 isoform X2 [Selaginella moellendorffii]|eukprot:XP_024533493.1 uncharacterized protein LOC9636559 isoform X2 [Selaginella moellendorffii]